MKKERKNVSLSSADVFSFRVSFFVVHFSFSPLLLCFVAVENYSFSKSHGPHGEKRTFQARGTLLSYKERGGLKKESQSLCCVGARSPLRETQAPLSLSPSPKRGRSRTTHVASE